MLVDHVKEELVEGGQRLYEDLKQSLIESGWRDELGALQGAMRARAKASSAELTLESLTKEVTRYAQGRFRTA